MFHAPVVELVDALDSKSSAARRVGSIPTGGTTQDAEQQSSEATMSLSQKNAQSEFAKTMAAACVRRGYLEKLHSGVTPVSRSGDYSDVKVIDAEGREIPWNEVSRINQDEMRTLMIGVVNRIHTFLARTLFSAKEDTTFHQAIDRAAVPWTKAWDEPQYLPDFLMPRSGSEG